MAKTIIVAVGEGRASGPRRTSELFDQLSIAAERGYQLEQRVAALPVSPGAKLAFQLQLVGLAKVMHGFFDACDRAVDELAPPKQ